MKKIILLALLSLSINSFAKEKLSHPDQSDIFGKITSTLEKDLKLASSVDDLDRLIFQDKKGRELAADLILTDIIDQMHLCMYRKKIRQTHYRLQKVLGHKPLQNFNNWWKLVSVEALVEGKARKCRKSLKVQLYDMTGRLLSSNMGGYQNLFRKYWGGKYDELMADPEGTHIAHYIYTQRKDKDIPNSLFTPRVTVTKYRLNIKNFNGHHRAQFYEKYFKLLAKAQEENQKQFNDHEEVSFSYRFKAGASNAILIEHNADASNDFINVTTPLYNTMMNLPFKLELFRYIQNELETNYEISIPTTSWLGTKNILLTPSLVHKHRELIAPLVKEFTFSYRLKTTDLNYLMHMRKWIKRNIYEIHKRAEQKNLFVSLNKKYFFLPGNSDVISNYETLEQLFPKAPWIDLMPELDSNGKRIYRVGRMKRILLRTRDMIKGVLSVENISSWVVGAGLYVLTGNPLLSAVSATIVRDIAWGLKYNVDLKGFLPKMIVNVGLASILASGFTGGRIPEQIFLGGMIGAAQAMATGQSLRVGALTGAVQNVLFGMLPARWHNPTLKGLGKDVLWKNALLEIAETTAKRSLTGLVISATTGGDPVEGALSGAAFGASEAVIKIAVYGIRYRPELENYDWSAENAYQIEHGVGANNIDDRLVQETIFRRDGLIQVFYERTFTLGNQVVMDAESVGNIGIEEHEMSHRSQNRHFGILGFNMRYVVENFKNGNQGANIYENYRYISHFEEIPFEVGAENPFIIQELEYYGTRFSVPHKLPKKP